MIMLMSHRLDTRGALRLGPRLVQAGMLEPIAVTRCWRVLEKRVASACLSSILLVRVAVGWCRGGVAGGWCRGRVAGGCINGNRQGYGK